MHKLNKLFMTSIQIKNTKKFIRIIFIAIVIPVILFIFTAAKTISYDKTYDGIKVNNINAGNYSKTELYNILDTEFKKNLSKTFLTIKANDIEKIVSFEQLEVAYDIKEIVNNSYEIGHSGNFLKDLYNIFNAGVFGDDVELKLTYNEEFLENTLEDVINKVSTPVKEAKIEENNKGIYLVAGKSGININKKKTINKIVNLLHTGSNCTISLNTNKVEPKEIDVNKFYKLLNTEIKNATLEIIDNEDYKIIPEVTGKEVSKAMLKSHIDKLNTSGDEKIKLPIKREIPKYTKEYIEENLFKDTLGKFETIYPVYNQAKLNRASNIKLAASKINNFILDSNEIFSFNKTLGKRTVEEGYQSATAFMNGEIVQSIGGGICQVSTTLHCAALEAEQEIIERKNHTYLVSYVTPGMDAAVSYGSLDYKFKNISKWPIKIKSKTTNDNKIIFEILGTNENENREISYYTQTVGTVTSKTKYTDDPTLENGKIIITEKGFNGLIVDTYKKVIVDGEIKENSLLYGSYYNAYDTKALRGTKQLSIRTLVPYSTKKSVNKTVKPTPSPTQTPVKTTNTPTNTPESDE